MLPPSADNGEAGPEPVEPSKKGCSVSNADVGGGGGLASFLVLGLGLLGWTRRQR